MTPAGGLYVAAAGLSVLASGWAVLARPSRPLLVLVILGISYFVYGAVYNWKEDERILPRTLAHYYSLDVGTEGLHHLQIKSVPEVPGLNVRPVPKGLRRECQSFEEDVLPVSWGEIFACGWKVRSPEIGIHLHDDRCQCSPKDDLLDTNFDDRFRNGAFDGIDLEYRVDDRTRPVLESIDLQVGYPFTYGNDVAVGRGICGCVGTVCVIGASVGMMGAACQVWRLVRVRKQNAQPSSAP